MFSRNSFQTIFRPMKYPDQIQLSILLPNTIFNNNNNTITTTLDPTI